MSDTCYGRECYEAFIIVRTDAVNKLLFILEVKKIWQ